MVDTIKIKEMKSLIQLKGELNTDKGGNYLSNYEKYFEHLRDKPINLLELGVNKGGSLLLWGRYFEKGTISGVDINDVDIKQNSKLHFFKGSQSDRNFLNQLAAQVAPGGFDIIIDDASHYGGLTKQSFQILFERHLKPGGIYVIEDWGTGYWPDWVDGGEFNEPMDTEKEFPSHHFGMVGMVKQLIDELARSDMKSDRLGNDPSKKPMIVEMAIYTGQVFLKKTTDIPK